MTHQPSAATRSETFESFCSLSPDEMFSLYLAATKEAQKHHEDIKLLKWQIQEMKRALYGKKSERRVIDTDSYPLLTGLVIPEYKSGVDKKPEEETITYTRNKPRKREEFASDGRFPDFLPRETVGKQEVSPDAIPCPDCDTPREAFTTRTAERLVYRRTANLVVEVTEIPVLRCPCCKDGIVSAPAPKTPFAGIPIESTFFAHLISEKCEFGLPIYRIEDKLKQLKVPFSRETLNQYLIKSGNLLKPIQESVLDAIMTGPYFHSDETGWRVALETKAPGKPGKKHYKNTHAVVMAGMCGQVVVRHRDALTKSTISDLVSDSFRGFIVCDGEDHYDAYAHASSAKLVRCNAHARRKFEAALQHDRTVANRILKAYGRLYQREDYFREREFSAEKIQRWRRRSKNLHEAIKNYCIRLLNKFPPKTPIGKAIRYYIRMYDDLVRYCDTGYLPIDNNYIERVIRKFVIGRKGWLFNSSKKGAHSLAVLYSLVLSCRNLDICPFDYLTDVIHQVGTLNRTDYFNLTPLAWKMAPTLS